MNLLHNLPSLVTAAPFYARQRELRPSRARVQGGGSAAQAAGNHSWPRLGATRDDRRLWSARAFRSRGRACVVVQANGSKRAPYWALREEQDKQVLGLEIRTNSVKAALIETSTGGFVGAGAATRLESVTPETVAEALQKIVKEQFDWDGLVGAAITKNVARELGVDTPSFSKMDRKVGELLNGMLPNNTVITLLDAEAGGYAELAYGPADFEEELVLVVTLGKAMGAVLYKQGHRVRNTGMNTIITGAWEQELEALDVKNPGAFPKRENVWGGLPEPAEEGEEGYEAWAAVKDMVGRYVGELCNYIVPDTILLLPTGSAMTQSTAMNALVSHLQELKATFDVQPQVSLVGSGGALVKGAAVGAMVEESVYSAISELRRAVADDVVMLQKLTPLQLRAVFDVFDRDADGQCTISEIERGLKVMGLTVDIATLEEKIGELGGKGNMVDFISFVNWWQSRVKSAPVTKITSAAEFKDILASEAGKLVVLEVSFTFCRPCKAFEPKFEKLAEQYKDARFVKVNGNENRSTIELCRDELLVERTPTFFFFKDGEQVHRHTGTNLDTFHEAMAGAQS